LTICAIHQPNFFPWLPYFDKIAMADIFIFLDVVAYPKSGNSMGSWCNRVKISMHEQDIWFSCPVIRESGPQLIKHVKINNRLLNVEKILKTLKSAYGKKENYKKLNEIVSNSFLNSNWDLLADFNIYLIKKISELLGLKTTFIRQSDLNLSYLTSNEMLIDLCSQVKANEYLCGLGAKNYMMDKIFQQNGINVKYQNLDFKYKNYNLSILNYLFEAEKEKWCFFNDKE